MLPVVVKDVLVMLRFKIQVWAGLTPWNRSFIPMT